MDLLMSQLRSGGQANPGVGGGDEAKLAGHVHGMRSVPWMKWTPTWFNATGFYRLHLNLASSGPIH